MLNAARSSEQPVEPPFDPVRSPDWAANYTGQAAATLAKLRMTGRGPAFIKLARNRVGYRQSALDAWLKERERRSTLEG